MLKIAGRFALPIVVVGLQLLSPSASAAPRDKTVTASPRRVNFGPVSTSDSASQTITFTNNGSESLSFTSSTWGGSGSGTGYSVVDDGLTNPDSCYTKVLTSAGDTCTFELQFIPAETGQHRSTFIVSFTDGAVHTVDVSLSGRGVSP